MICIQLRIPPLPQLLTVGHSVWQPGNQHFKRTFGVYDLILVKRGALYMTEEGEPHAVGPGELLLLEPGLAHWGHEPCREDTELYWLHFVHGEAGERIEDDRIPWSALIEKGRDQDQTPSALQHLYLPKRGKADLQALGPVLHEMNELHNRLNAGSAIRLHRLFAELLTLLQEGIAGLAPASQSERISALAADYLGSRWREPFDSKGMQEELHFHIDYVARCMKKHLGMTPLQYVLHLRLEEARKLLTHTVLTIPEIAEQVGIPETNYFVRLFSKKLGMPPGAYRKMRRPEG
ncbi:helix-turn-helix transcriptional regulator [Gorillibacterium sp. sgz5001074]|uniref:helix-turn-helix transcriptional regulator n=1 Tax=Gorillibacterium sp. sgz5001074 TaxID=3446695 RepID=UPI003F675302